MSRRGRRAAAARVGRSREGLWLVPHSRKHCTHIRATLAAQRTTKTLTLFSSVVGTADRTKRTALVAARQSWQGETSKRDRKAARAGRLLRRGMPRRMSEQRSCCEREKETRAALAGHPPHNARQTP